MKLFSSCFALCKAAKERVSFSISSLAAVILLLIFHMNPLLDFFCVWSIVFLKIVRFLTLCLFQSSNISSSNWLSVSRTLIMESEMPVLGRNLKAQFTIVFRAISSKSVSHGDCLPFLTASLRLLFLQYVLWALHRILQHRKSRLQIVASKKITTFSEYIGFVDDSATGTFVMLNSSLA